MKIKIAKFGSLLVSRPAGREAGLAFLAYQKPGAKSRIVTLDFGEVFSLAPSWLDEFVETLKKADFKIRFGKSDNPSVVASIKAILVSIPEIKTGKKPHPWRLCPIGEHWVRRHPRTKPKSHGYADVDGHCQANPSKKDTLYPEEILRITQNSAAAVKQLPLPGLSAFKPNNNLFDRSIGVWTQYWNEVLKPRNPLDSNLVKALIASESGFRSDARPPRAKTRNAALGLMQLTGESVRILKDLQGELGDHLIVLDLDDRKDPDACIAAGIRWLFHKKNLLAKKLHREPSWVEAIAEYKSYTKRLARGDAEAKRKFGAVLTHYRSLTGKGIK